MVLIQLDRETTGTRFIIAGKISDTVLGEEMTGSSGHGTNVSNVMEKTCSTPKCDGHGRRTEMERKGLQERIMMSRPRYG